MPRSAFSSRFKGIMVSFALGQGSAAACCIIQGMNMAANNLLRDFLSRPMFQPMWSKLLKLCHAGMNYGGGQSIGASGELGALTFASQFFSPQQPLVVFDVGANDGEYVEAARARLPSENLRVFCFEPQRSSFLALQSGYRDDPLIEIRHAALGQECGTAELFYSTERESTASLHGTESGGPESSEQVEVTTVDEVCREAGVNRIHLLKIDTEGHEVDVLLGAQKMMEEGRITAIQVEYGDTFLHTKYHFCDLFDLLSPRYRIYRILRSGLFEIPHYSHDLEIYKIANFLCIAKECESGSR
jgi:FkbM family methyltransferase